MKNEIREIVEHSLKKREAFPRVFFDEKNRMRSFQYKLLDKTWEGDINALYSNYSRTTKLPEEFLAIPSADSVKEVLDSDKKFFMGIVVDTPQIDYNAAGVMTYKKELVGIAKVYICDEKEDFFQPPKKSLENNDGKLYFGISAMLVDNKYSGKKFGEYLVNGIIENLKGLNFAGVYADCDFRNIASFRALSANMDFIGFTDGRQGADGEKTIYTTFFADKKDRKDSSLKLDISKAKNTDEVKDVLLDLLNEMGNNEVHKRNYGGGHNYIYVTEKPISTKGINVNFGNWKPSRPYDLVAKRKSQFLASIYKGKSM